MAWISAWILCTHVIFGGDVTDNLETARSEHTATLLSNGKVLVVGGSNPTFLNTAELYDPVTNIWTTLTDTLTTRRSQHTATRLNSGNVLVTGGFNGGYLNRSELYDIATGNWSSTLSLRTARANHTTTVLNDGRVLVAGGFSSGSGFITRTEIYDESFSSRIGTPSMQRGREHHTATLLTNGMVLVVGGADGTGSINHAELYKPAPVPNTGSWSASPPDLKGKRSQHTATLLTDGRVLVVGGTDGVNSLDTVEIYSADAQTVAPGAKLSVPRQLHAATILSSGHVLVTGGVNGQGPVSEVELYNPSSGTWSVIGRLHTPRSQHTATLLPDGRVLVAGGSDGTNSLASAELYHTITVSTNTDSEPGSLRQALADALDGWRIEFSPSLVGKTIGLTSGELVIDKNLTIDGPGADNLVISGGTKSRVFYVENFLQNKVVFISGLTITAGNGVGNRSGQGGAIYNGNATLTVSNCTISASTGDFGGGICSQNSSPSLLILGNCTLFGNSATNLGGGIYGGSSGTKASLEIQNCTISSNYAGLSGGGVYFFSFASKEPLGTASIESSSVVENTAPADQAGAIDNNGAKFTISNSVIKRGTTGRNFLGSNDGKVTSFGTNLSDDDSTTEFATQVPDLKLGPLADNGGPTPTHALLRGSPAIDAGNLGRANAWQIADVSTVAGSILGYAFTNTVQQKSAADGNGWHMTVVSRLVAGSGASSGSKPAHFMVYGNGSRRFFVGWDADADNRLWATFSGVSTAVQLSGAGQATNAYHRHEILYDPASQQATYRMDGVRILTWAGIADSFQNGAPGWGSGSSAAAGRMNYHHVQFEINGLGTTAEYFAGLNGNPSEAKHPSLQGWTQATANPPAGTITEGAINVDPVSLSSSLVNSVVTANDQRGPGFARQKGVAVDVGAFELQSNTKEDDFRKSVLSEKSLLGFYSMEGDVKPRLLDKSPGGHHDGTLAADAFFGNGPGTVGAYSLEGGRADLGIVHDYTFPLFGAGTVEAVVYQTGTVASGNPCVFSCRGANQATQTRYSIHLDGRGRNLLYVFNGQTETAIFETPSSFVGQRVHLVVVFFGDDTVDAYFNGALLGTRNFQQGTILSDPPCQIGAANADNFEPFFGQIDELALYSAPLSVSSITNRALLLSASSATKSKTTTTVEASKSVAAFGEPVTLTARVVGTTSDASTPTGTVEFLAKLGGVSLPTLGSTNLSSAGIAVLTTASLPVASAGSLEITASYAGDANHDPSVSSKTQLTVAPAETSTTLQISPSSSRVGDLVTFSAQVRAKEPSNGTAAGSVEFFDGAIKLGDGNTDATGLATLAISTLKEGSHRGSAHFKGGVNFQQSDSPAVDFSVSVQPPVIVEQPVGKEVTEGNPVELKVVAQGVGLTYQWFKGWGTGRTSIPGANSDTFTVVTAQLGTSGFYSVDVSNNGGSISSETVLLAVQVDLKGRLVLLKEDFESLKLGPNIEEGIVTGAGTPPAQQETNVWTKSAPSGWSHNDLGVPGVGTELHGVTEWAGWSFANRKWWSNTAEDQHRSDFSKGTGTIAIADGDEWSDLGPPAGPMSTYLSSLPIPLRGVKADSVVIKFDSSWRPEVAQRASMEISFDDGPAVSVLEFSSFPDEPSYRPDSVNETISVPVNNPENASFMTVRFHYFDATNNWWWAFDNLLITGISKSLFFENFESLALGPNIEEGIITVPSSGITQSIWTKTPPEGWSQDDSGVPGAGTDQDGVTEWAGWSFANRAWWSLTDPSPFQIQQRSGFSKGVGAIAIVDSDEWDDVPHAEGNMATRLTTPAIDVSSAEPGSLLLTFDSSWKPEGIQRATISVAYDAGAPIEMLRWDSDEKSPQFHPDSVNETVSLGLNNPQGAKTMKITLGYFDARNNWWWAVDNFEVSKFSFDPVPTISISPNSDGTAVIQFEGTLEDSISLGGGFAPVPGATSPYTVPRTDSGPLYFRSRR